MTLQPLGRFADANFGLGQRQGNLCRPGVAQDITKAAVIGAVPAPDLLRLVRLAVQVAIWPLLVTVKLVAIEMGFPDQAGPVAGLAEYARNRDRIGFQNVPVLVDAQVFRVLSCQKGTSAGNAERILAIGVGERDTFPGKLVQVWGFHRIYRI